MNWRHTAVIKVPSLLCVLIFTSIQHKCRGPNSIANSGTAPVKSLAMFDSQLTQIIAHSVHSSHNVLQKNLRFEKSAVREL